jgi:hypothetical protein
LGVLWQTAKFAALSGVTFTGLALTGCGGDAAPPQSKAKGSSPVASAPSGGGPGYGGSSPYGSAEPEKPPRPEDVKAWTDQDFLDAKKESDPRIGPAALAYAKSHVGDNAAGEFLVALVTKEPEVEGEGGGSSPYGGGGYGRSTGYNPGSGDSSTDGFVGVIAALGVNNTKPSRDALNQILAGKLATPLDDSEAANTALRTLASNAHPDNEATLLNVLSAPEKIRPAPAAAGAGTDGSAEVSGVTAATLQQEALSLVAPTASAELRTKLANRLLQSLAQGGSLGGGPEGNPLVTFLLEPRPANVEAQAALYALPALPAEVRSQIEANFLAFSSSALRELLNMPRPSGEAAEAIPTAGYGRASGPAYGRGYGASPAASAVGAYSPSGEPAAESDLTPEQAARVATSVWRNDMIKALAGRLPKGRVQRTADAETSANQPLLLLASMPVDPARTALSDWLERQREEAAQALLAAGAFEQAMSDPGLLAIIKPLERAKRPPRRARRGEDEAAAPAGPGAANDEADALRDLVEVLCRRAKEGGQGGGASSEFPVAFQGESSPSVQLSGDFPGAAKLNGLQPVPVAVHYAFIEQEHKLPIVQGHYSRQLKNLVDAPRVKELGDSGVWLDSYKRDKKTGKAKSVDVFIRRAGDANATSSAGGSSPYSGSAANDEPRSRRPEPENLTIEILVVETQTPPDEKPAAEVTRKP